MALAIDITIDILHLMHGFWTVEHQLVTINSNNNFVCSLHVIM